MKKARSIIIIMIMVLISSIPAYAHKMNIEPLENGIVKVHYDDGSFSSRTEVTVYNSNDEVIETGKLNQEGKYTYDTNQDISYIVADDGMGHRAEWKVGELVEVRGGGSKFIKIGIVVLVLGAIAGISYRKKAK